jgi:hypothetical protein
MKTAGTGPPEKRPSKLLQLPFLIATEDTFNEFEVEDNPAGQF